MSNYALRVSRSWQECGAYLVTLFDLFERVIVFQHDADEDVNRTHIHVLMLNGARGASDDSIRTKWLKPAYYHEVNGKKVYDYELKQSYKRYNDPTAHAVDVNYIVYMGKGMLKPEYTKGFGIPEVTELVSQWVPRNSMKAEKGKIVITKEEAELRRKKKYDIVTLCAQKWNDSIDKSQERLAKIVVDMLHDQKQCIGKWKIIDICDAVEMYADPRKYVEQLGSFLEARKNKIF